MTLKGFAPSVKQSVLHCVGAIALTGFAPKALLLAKPGLGAVTLAGLAPSVKQTVFPGVGAIALTAPAPKALLSVLPATGSIKPTGNAPQIVVRPATILQKHGPKPSGPGFTRRRYDEIQVPLLTDRAAQRGARKASREA